ncbi:HSP70/90 family co-chaperone CNS1 [Aspergillus glaucus CBS 516.65]|uniref:Cns1/TTC4 wheel domain-containing protein n=1 Tax=Aspergillus glaucus CBS 516.65 TaxID=1160497 RepID=A0A1L9VFG2_ASPGL|nr:hypothetical protein ASPGLDRAFT_483418 [Aspergillus glaucus CBS 516.65]OJJ82650.1 hypothetical protein ASPGLDRAFT_483418 [Aspergillus glaucus CBS 516.65]
MPQIEELPDDFDESIDLNKQPKPAADLPGMPPGGDQIPFPINEERMKELEAMDPLAPKMPPNMASVKSHTKEELLDMMNKTPLFMTDISQAGDENGENVMLDALYALQNEGTRGDVAQNFYSKAIAVVLAKEDKWDKPENPEEDKKVLRQAEEASYINRALCHLELRNYRSCTLDCASALKLNPENVKAFYRSSTALYALDKVPEAEDAASRGLELDPENKPLQATATKIAERKAALERIATKKKAEADRIRKETQLLTVALKAREIRTRKTGQPPEMEDAGICLSPDPLSPDSTLEFPAVFLYPTDAQSDFIKAFSEMHSIEDHLDYIFPLPWDTKKEYTIDNVECYMQTVAGGLIKAGKKLPLLQILSGGKVEVVDELVAIYVVPSSKTGRFISEMKARKESGS